ncbi:MAG: DMT family transporter [Bacteroidota bacterium]|nr:DMT family transporter [Bacteroidota bacterium]MDX5429745.1 DMT family transporter [Bacteroidota bacterium]MDX5468524.1 DMT family transporter [Bacteroidota bacterium]
MKKFFPLAYVLLIVLGMIWGSSFILIKRGLQAFEPVQVGSLRIFIAGLVLLPVFIQWLPKAKKHNYKWFALSGLLGNGLPAILFAIAQTHLSSSIAGALNSLTPMFALLVGVIVYKLPFDRSKSLGVGVGLLGALALILLGEKANFKGDLAYASLVIIAALFYGINVNLIKEKFAESKPMVIAAFPIVFMAIPAFFVLLGTGFFSLDFTDTQALKSLGAIAILAIFGTALSLVAFNHLIQMTNAVFASLTTYIIPIVALLWGVWDGETMTLPQIGGMALILIGVLLVRRKSPAHK